MLCLKNDWKAPNLRSLTTSFGRLHRKVWTIWSESLSTPCPEEVDLTCAQVEAAININGGSMGLIMVFNWIYIVGFNGNYLMVILGDIT